MPHMACAPIFGSVQEWLASTEGREGDGSSTVEEEVAPPNLRDMPLPHKLLQAQQAPEETTNENVSRVENSALKLIIYDIPFQATLGQVIERLTEQGFAEGRYQDVIMPSSKGGCNKLTGFQSRNNGYAFIKFNDAESAADFLSTFQNISWPNFNCEKLTCAKPAHADSQLAGVVKVPRRRKQNKRSSKSSEWA